MVNYIPKFFPINATTIDKLTTIIEYEMIPKHTAIPNISYNLDCSFLHPNHIHVQVNPPIRQKNIIDFSNPYKSINCLICFERTKPIRAIIRGTLAM